MVNRQGKFGAGMLTGGKLDCGAAECGSGSQAVAANQMPHHTNLRTERTLWNCRLTWTVLEDTPLVTPAATLNASGSAIGSSLSYGSMRCVASRAASPQSEKIAPVGLILTMPPPALLVLWPTRRSVAKAVRDSVSDWPPRREGPEPDAAAESPLRPDVRVTPSISLGRGSPDRPPFSASGAEPAGRR